MVIFRGFYLVGGVEEAFRIANENGRIQFFKWVSQLNCKLLPHLLALSNLFAFFVSSTGLDPYATNNLWNCVLGMGIMWMGNYCTTQTEVARYSNVSSRSKARL